MPSLSGNDLTVQIKTTSDTSGVDKTKQSIDSLDDSSNKNSKSGALLGATWRLAAAGAVALGAATTASAISGFKFNSSVEQATAKLMAFTKDSTKVAETLAWVKQEAAATQFSFKDMANAAGDLTPVSKSTGTALKDLIKQAEILAALNPAEGLTGATFSLREALSGDWVSIIDRFNLPRKRINELKEQGVPAMEIISRTMNEMGIDYGLVSAQGQTAAARFDQLKDKLQMLAGEATKPIFDKVSIGLVTLSEWVDKIKPTLQALADLIREYVAPYVAIWAGYLGDQLLPALQRLWTMLEPVLMPVLKALALAIGVVLVVALAVAVTAITLIVQAISFLASGLSNVIQWVKNFANAIADSFSWAKNTIAGIWGGIESALTSPIVKAKDAIKSVLDQIEHWINNITGKIDGFKNTVGSIGSSIKDRIPGFSVGGYTGRGGMNEIAGVVHKGEYVIPKSQVDQSSGMPKASSSMGGGTVINQTNNIYNQTDMRQANIELGWKLAT